VRPIATGVSLSPRAATSTPSPDPGSEPPSPGGGLGVPNLWGKRGGARRAGRPVPFTTSATLGRQAGLPSANASTRPVIVSPSQEPPRRGGNRRRGWITRSQEKWVSQGPVGLGATCYPNHRADGGEKRRRATRAAVQDPAHVPERQPEARRRFDVGDHRAWDRMLPSTQCAWPVTHPGQELGQSPPAGSAGQAPGPLLIS
jgi:hypothetical protein